MGMTLSKWCNPLLSAFPNGLCGSGWSTYLNKDAKCFKGLIVGIVSVFSWYFVSFYVSNQIVAPAIDYAVLTPLGFESVRTFRLWSAFTMFGLTPFVQNFLGLTPFAYKLLGIDGSREPSELERAEARNKQMKANTEAMRNKTDRVEHEHREAHNETTAVYQALEREVKADTSNRTWVIYWLWCSLS